MSGTAVALVGLGAWGRHVLRDLVALGCAVTVVSRGGRARDEALAAGAVGVVHEVGDLDGRAAGAVVTTPTSVHAASIEQCLAVGLPVFAEKPLTDDPVSAERIARAAPDRVFVMHKWRYHPGVELLRDIARSGELGDVVGLRATRVGWGNPHGDVDGVWILVPHDLSIALEILGTIPEPRAAVVERVRGTVTGIVALLGDDPWFAVDSSTAHPIRSREIRVIGSEAAAVLPDPYSDHVLVTRGEVHARVTREDARRAISTELPLLRELRAFVGYLEGGPAPRSSVQEGLADVRTIARLRELAGAPVASVAG